MIYVNDSSRVWHVAKTGNDNNSGHAGQYPVNLANDAKLTITAATNAAANGDVVVIWPGDYAENVDVSSKTLTLIGISRTKSRIVPASGCALKPGSDSEIRSLCLDGSNDMYPNYGISASSKNNIVISDCDIYGAYDGINALNATHFRIDKCRIRSKYDGLTLIGSTDFLVTDSIIQALGTYGTSVHSYAIYGSGSGIYRNCIFQASRSDTSSQNVGGVEVKNGDYVIFDHCLFESTAGTNITGTAFGLRISEAGIAVLSHCLLKARSLRTPPTTVYDIWQLGDGKIVVVGGGYGTSNGTIVQGGDGWASALGTALFLNGGANKLKIDAEGRVDVGEINGSDAELLARAAKMLLNKAVQDKLSGTIRYYDDDSQTVILTHTPNEDGTSLTRAVS